MSLRHMENVLAHLGACLMQRSKSDDNIIMDHVQDAYDAAKKAVIVYEGRDHHHVAGTTIGKHIDECAICGKDLRDPIHGSVQ